MRKVRGFTLIEVMLVVAIVGILAVLAVYGVHKYLMTTKTAEARNALGRIGQDAIARYATHGDVMCASATTTVPASADAIRGRKYQSSPAEWNVDQASDKGFACLMFEMSQPQYFMYGYTAQGSNQVGDSFTASAYGDLDGDGALSTFTLQGAIAPGKALTLAPTIGETNPEE